MFFVFDSYQHFYSFPTMSLKGFLPRVFKSEESVVNSFHFLLDNESLTHSHTMTPFDAPGKQAF